MTSRTANPRIDKGRRRRILVISAFPPDPYGEASLSFAVYPSMAKQYSQDVGVLILAHKNRTADDLEWLLPNLCVKRVTYPTHPLRRHLAPVLLLREILAYRPHAVHFQAPNMRWYGGLFGEPVTLLMYILRLIGIPVVATIHTIWTASDLDDFLQDKKASPLVARLFKWLYRANLRMQCRTIGSMNILSAGQNSPVIKKFQSAYSLKFDVLRCEPHGCNCLPTSKRVERQAKAVLGLHGYRVLFSMGFVQPTKGYHLLLDGADELLGRFPDLVIVIAGKPHGKDGAAYAELLRDKASRIHGNERIILKFEYLSQEELTRYLDASDIVVVPYLKIMGPSGIAHHAFGRGKPVVASALPHNLGLGDICRLVQPGNTHQLKDVIISILENSEEYEKRRERGLAYARAHGWQKTAEMYMRQYQGLAK